MRKLMLGAVATAVALLASPEVARAEDNVADVPATGKGIVGGALLGGEVVMLTEAAFRVKPWWAYAIGGVAGGVAGGVGGYFAEQGGDAKLSMYLLTGGMALAIPTTVAVLSASRYEPPANYTEDHGPADEPVAEPAQAEPPPAAEAPAPTSRRATPPARLQSLPAAPPSLVGISPEALTLGVPAVEVRDLYTREDMFRYGVTQKAEVRVPVLSYVF
ncbi:MAG: hypothetical protein R3B13_09725 [Polyangiaceae bacterium]